MDKQQLTFQYKDKQVMEKLLMDVSAAIKDSDATEEKEAVRTFLQKVSEALIFVTIGSSGVGKSSFINKLFQYTLFAPQNGESTRGIREYRYGAAESIIRVNEFITRIFRQREELDGLQIVDMQGIETMAADGLLECAKEYLYKSSVLFAIFDAQNVKDYAVWDILEGVETRKVVFVLTKCDLAAEDIVGESENRLRQYMKEAGIMSPIFRISSKPGENNSDEDDGYEALRNYISSQIIGDNPTLTKQQENLVELKKMLKQLEVSFGRRKQQYEADAAILKNINLAIDSFVTNNYTHVEELKASLKREIDSEIEAYQNEIITKLDPHKIKERFPNGSADFMDYLNLMNEGYRKRMTDNINRRTQESVQAYLGGLEQVFEQAVGYLQKRENILALEDKFYGSMIDSKKVIVSRTAGNMEVTKDYYHSLTNASTELFMKLWKARGEREKVLGNAKAVGGVVGAATGGGAGLAIAHALGTAVTAVAGTTATTTAVTAIGAVLWPVVGLIIGGIVIAKIAKKIASANTLLELEQKVAEAIAEFKEEVAKTKTEMTTQILDTVDKIFQFEIENVDKSFVEFRMSVNIDSKNIPLLEQKLNTIHDYMQQIQEMEERSIINV